MSRLKRTTEEVRVYFAENNCELLGEYVGALVPMPYRCSCGRVSKISWNNFTKGKRCGYCTKHRHKYSLEEVRDIFSKRGCTLLVDEYRGNKIPLDYRCKCGRKSRITLVALLHQSQLCRACGLEKNKKEKHHAWIADREEKRHRDLFRKKCYKALSRNLKATGKKKVGRTSDMLGYSPSELREHVENHPNWPKVKDKSWHLDHIFPINAFLDYGVYDQDVINDLDNLQPVTQSENNIKHAKYDVEEFERWLESKGYEIHWISKTG